MLSSYRYPVTTNAVEVFRQNLKGRLLAVVVVKLLMFKYLVEIVHLKTQMDRVDMKIWLIIYARV